MAFGAWVGVSATLVLAWALDSSISLELQRFYVFLFSASVSLFAAAVALVGVLSNIEHQNEVSAHKRSRRLAAVRATMPSALAQLSTTFQKAAAFSQEWNRFIEEYGADDFRQLSLKEIALDEATVSVLREILELTDSDLVADRISGIMREHQVCYSRWQSLFDDQGVMPPTPLEVSLRTTHWIFLKAVLDTLYDYARGEEDDVLLNVDEEAIRSSMRTCRTCSIFPEKHEQAIKMLARAFLRRFQQAPSVLSE